MNARRAQELRQVAEPLHLVVKWNPGDTFESATIAAHASILAASEDDESYVWWGKISKTGKLGITVADFKRLVQQIKRGVETHLYLYCPDKPRPTLHVGLCEGAIRERPSDPSRIPEYYSKLAYPIPFWFRLSDLREISFEHCRNILLLDGSPFDPVAANLYPMLVKERRTLTLFDYAETGGAKWFVLQRLHQPSTQAQIIEPNLAFVLMPFEKKFNDVWKLGVKPAVESLGMECRRADDFLHNRDIMEVVRENIRRARVLVADMSTNNPNVFYELGFAHALDKPVVLITEDRSSVPFDLRSVNNLEYSEIALLRQQLPPLLKAILRMQ